jgi:adenine-specific DNA-methyltransferase
VDGPAERYGLNWPGKRAAIRLANSPTAKTLRPVRSESVEFDTTQNLFIEGDNLEALKLLQKSYLGKVDLIYIDPPYNTGNDFIYNDTFADDPDEFKRGSGQADEAGNRMTANPTTAPRYHSNWLSMMYPRLRLAKNLLSNRGAIFISINDTEAASLRTLADTVFGSNNFIGTFVWKSRQNVDSRNVSNLSADHEYICVWARDTSRYSLTGQDIDTNKYANPDNDPGGPWMSNSILGLADATHRPNLHYEITDPKTGMKFAPPEDTGWRFGKDTMASKIAEGRIIFPDSSKGRPRQKLFLRELKMLKTGISSVLGKEAGFTLNGTREVRQIMNGRYFDFPKPISLMKILLKQGLSDDQGIVLDFFAGSGTTAHAVMQANAEDGGHRRFIMVQLDENTPEGSAAQQAGFENIAQLARERIRRAGKKIKEEAADGADQLDTGFRCLRIDDSNFRDVRRTPDATEQADLLGLVSNVKPGRSGEDLLFQTLVCWGLPLDLPIQVRDIDGTAVFDVDDGGLLACFANRVSEAVVRAMAESRGAGGRRPVQAVFRDDAFASDAERINAEPIFKQLSPGTKLRVI